MRSRSLNQPEIIRLAQDMTLRWPCRRGDFILWMGYSDIFAGPESIQIRDLWEMRDGYHVTITNRPEDFPAWFELHPTEVCNSLVLKMAARIEEGHYPIVGMKPPYAKRKLLQHGLQHWDQPCFADLRGRAYHFPLRHFIHCVDVVHTFDPVPISLMHRVHPQVSGPSVWLGRSPLPNGHLRRPRWLIYNPALPIGPALPKTIQLRHRNLRQLCVLQVAEVVALALRNLPRRRPAERLMRFVYRSQQFDIGPRIAGRKLSPPVSLRLHLVALPVLSDQPRDLRPAHSRHFRQVAPHQPATGAFQLAVCLLSQSTVHPPGFREQEVMFMRWSDVNFQLRTVRVTSKQELGFYPKRWEDREIPAPVELIDEHRKHTHRPNCQFVFPSPTGNREQHMLAHCKSIAKRAKLDPTEFDLKTFRSTYATGMLRRGFDVRTVQHWMGTSRWRPRCATWRRPPMFTTNWT
jgi:hypothetical protein